MKSIYDLRKIVIMFLCLTLLTSLTLTMYTTSVEAASSGQETVIAGQELTFNYDDNYEADIAVINPSFGENSPFKLSGTVVDQLVINKESEIYIRSADAEIGYMAPHFGPYIGDYSSVLTATVGEAPNRQLIIQYTNMSIGEDPVATYQVILHETTNDIDYQYVRLTPFDNGNVVFGSEAWIGIEDYVNDSEVVLSIGDSEDWVPTITEKSAARFKSDGEGGYTLDDSLSYNPIILVASGKPAPAVQVSPSNGQTVGTNVRLSWEAVQHAKQYIILIATDPSFSEDSRIYLDEIYKDTNVVAKGLDPKTTYYWKVMVYNEAYDAFSISNTSSFTTLDEFNAAATTALNQQTEQLISGTTVKFNHSYKAVVADQDGDGLPDALPLGFDFNFNGKTYNEIYANTSGLLMFEDIQADSNLYDKTLPLPYVPGEYDDGTKVDHFITAYHSPLSIYGDKIVSYATIGEAPNRQFIIQYTNSYYNYKDVGTFQVILNEGSNEIQFQYPHILNGMTGSRALVAIQEKPMNGQASKFAIYSQQQAKLSEKLAVKFVTSGNGYSIASNATYLPVLIMSEDFPSVPVITLPVDGGVGSTLTWEGDADEYVLLISQDAGFNSYEWIEINSNTYTAEELIPNKVYYAKVVAYKGYNRTYSNTIRFATSLSADATISAGVSSVGATNASLSANVVTNQEIISSGFLYGTSSDLIFNDNNEVADIANGEISKSLTGLIEDNTYYAKAYIITAEGIYYGNTVSFTTAKKPTPTPTPTPTPVVPIPTPTPVVPTPTPVVPTPKPSPTPTPNIVLNDVAGHWAEDNINKAIAEGFVKGYPDGGFHPNAKVTRAEFATMLMRALGADNEGTTLNFTDNSKIGTWAQQAIAQAVELGYLGGYPDGSFRPNDVLTRAEMAVIVAKVLELTGTTSSTSFADDATIPSWAKNAIASLQEKGLVSGKPGNKYDPSATTTRVEAVTLILNMLTNK